MSTGVIRIRLQFSNEQYDQLQKSAFEEMRDIKNHCRSLLRKALIRAGEIDPGIKPEHVEQVIYPASNKPKPKLVCRLAEFYVSRIEIDALIRLSGLEFRDRKSEAVKLILSELANRDDSAPIEKLGLSTRPYLCMRRANYKFIYQLVEKIKSHGLNSLKKHEGVGKATLAEIEAKLKEQGYL